MSHPLIEPLEARIAPATLAIAPASIQEGNSGTTDLVFTVTLTGSISSDVMVHFATADGSAVADADYVTTAGTLTFHPGDTAQLIHVPINGDLQNEVNETFTVALDTPTGDASIAAGAGTATGTIQNDDVPTVSIADASVTEGDNGTKNLDFTISLSSPSAQAVRVTAKTSDGTAKATTDATSDYDAKMQTFTIQPGNTTATFSVAIHGDTFFETNETFFVDLSAPINATFGDGQAIGTIQNDEPPPTLSIGPASLVEGNSGTSAMQFTITLSGKSASPVSVVATTADNTAVKGSDYAMTTATLTFAPGETMKTFTVPINGDGVDENDETFFVDLSGAMPADTTITTARGIGTITNDDLQVTVGDIGMAETNGDTTFTFLVHLSSTPTHSVTVGFNTLDGTAVATPAGTDYDPISGTLMFAEGEDSKEINVTVHGDLVGEFNETFFLQLTSVTNATLASTQATATIQNDDPALRIDDVQVLEGNADTVTQMKFTVTLDAAPAEGNVSVDVMSFDGTATTADNDYVPVPLTTLTFGPGETTKTVSVPIIGDNLHEHDETFIVRLSNPTNATIIRETGTGTIKNDDAAPEITIEDVTIMEGDSGTEDAVFKIKLNKPSATVITVKAVTADGSATAGSDYDLTTQTITFNPGDPTEKFFSVPVHGDLIHELNETFFVNLSEQVNATLGDSQGVGTIQNDDAPPVISIDDAPIVVEGDSDTKNAIFTVRLSGASSSDVTVVATTADDTAKTGDADYIFTSSTVTIKAGETMATFVVPIRGDRVFEPGPTETFFVNLTNPTVGTLGDSQAIGTIQNDDLRPTINVADITMLEGDSGTTNAAFKVVLSNPSSQEIKITVATSDGTAIAGSDYVAGGTTLTFNPGETEKTFNVVVNSDTLNEGDEHFFLDLSDPVNGDVVDFQARATITNDDVPRVRVTDVSIVEGNSGNTMLNFMVRLSTVSATPISVDYETLDDSAVSTGAGADFTAQMGTLTFAPGEVALPIAVTIAGDVTGELDESFFLKLTGATGALITRDTAVGTILNDDAVLRISDAQVLEGNAGSTTQMVFTVTLEHGPATGDVTVNWAPMNGDATSSLPNNDFIDPPNNPGDRTLTFLPGETTKTISIAIMGDGTVESNEDFQVKLSGASSNVTVVRDAGVGSIINDDGNVFTVNDVTVTEGDSGTANAVFLVRLLNPTFQRSGELKVDVQTANGTATSDGINPDFDAVTQTLTFAPNVSQLLVKVPIHGDLIKEGAETFLLRLLNPSSDATIARVAGTGTILDNNDPLPTVSIANGTLAEGDLASTFLIFQATLSQPSESPVTVSFKTHDGSGANAATIADHDYIPVTNGSVTFEPGQVTTEILVPIVADTVDESDETFSVEIFDAVNATVGNSTAVGTIQNDEVRFSIGDMSVTEGNNGTTVLMFPVTLNQAPNGHSVSVNYATANSTAVSSGANVDYVSKTGTLTFDGTTGLTQFIKVTVNGDTRIEGDEQFFVNLLTPVNATLADGQAIGTIVDDDGMPKISISDASLTEGDSGTSAMNFTITLDKPSDLPVTVKVNTANGTAEAGAGKDYTALTDQTITFAPGEQSKTVTVQVLGDTLDEFTANEAKETFAVNLSSPANAMLDVAHASATGTILDNDTRVLGITNVSVTEGDAGTKTLTFRVTLPQTKQTVMVDYFTENRSALAGEDYVAASGTLTFMPDELFKDVQVTINGDTKVEGNEFFVLKLSNAQKAMLGVTEARGTIVDDESTFRLERVPSDASNMVDEESGFIQFRVLRDNANALPASVQYQTVDGTATSTGPRPDFTAKMGTISFAANDASDTLDKVITIPIKGDLNYENNETFTIELFNPINAGIIDSNGDKAEKGSQIVTILNNDVRPTISIGDARIVENDSGQQLHFMVTLSAANEVEDVTLKYFTKDGPDGAPSPTSTTARPSVSGNFQQDYQQVVEDQRTITKGSLGVEIPVTIKNDSVDEFDEEFLQVELKDIVGASAGDLVGLGTIVDDDAAPTLQFGASTANVTANEGDTGESNATFNLRLSAVSERPVSVEVTTHEQTAVSSGTRPDFTALDHKVFTYTPGDQQPQINITIPILGDTVNEADETFNITLSNPQFAQLQATTGTVTIHNDDPAPVISVNDVSSEEGNDGTTDMIFTVSLSEASDQVVKVPFATKDGTATSTGPMADYIAKSGTLKFLPGETSKEVRVKVLGDTFKEDQETFTLELNSAKVVNGTVVTAAGTGTILNDTPEADSKLGIAVRDAFAVEGSSLTFTVELSEVNNDADTPFKIVGTNGTAVRGQDFIFLKDGAIVDTLSGVIPKGQKSTPVTVVTIGDTTFEATESLFLGLRDVPQGVTIVGDKGRGTIFNDDVRQLDSHTVQFIDVDGDLATVHVSKGNLGIGNLAFGPINPDTGGRELQTLNLLSSIDEFKNSNVSVTAGAQKGFRGDAQGRMGNGHVNVGLLAAAIPRSDILQVTNGIDLRTVRIDGDLATIYAGDIFATPAIGRLEVQSFGARGHADPSLILGTVNNLHIAGKMGGTLNVLGDIFGTIRNLHIGGTLAGGSDPESGFIQFTGKIRNGYIGSIEGGSGAKSGMIFGALGTNSSIDNLRIGGLVTGGTGKQSGNIIASTISTLHTNGLIGGEGIHSGRILGRTLEHVIIDGNVNGGSGKNTGQIFGALKLGTVKIQGRLRGDDGERSGTVISATDVESVSILGGISGGAGDFSGRVQASDTIKVAKIGGITGAGGEKSGTIKTVNGLVKLNVFGDITGGSGAESGGIEVGGFLGNGVIDGGIKGGSAKVGTSLVKSGYVLANRIRSLYVGGNLEAGQNDGNGLALSGTIRAEKTIDFLRIHGDVLGNEGTRAIISAEGKGDDQTAITNLRIDGFARFAEILAGYNANATTSDPRGEAVNADAHIGTVRFGGDVESISVIAGVAAGTDGLFGTADDTVLAGSDDAKAQSKIAKIIIEGTARPGTTSTGILAQFVNSLWANGSNVELTSGAGNDSDRMKEVADGSGIHVFELPLPS